MGERLKKGLGWVVMAVMLSGCGAMAAPEREFSSVTRDYTMRLRWMDFFGASRHFEAPRRDGFLQQIAGIEDLHMVDVSLESFDFSQEGSRAQTVIVLEYYILPSATVERMRLNQQWEYQEADRYHAGVWRIVSPFPPFP